MLRTVPVSHVPGVGAAKSKLLALLNIESVDDLLHYYPRGYEDRSVRSFEQFVEGTVITARAVVDGNATVRWRGQGSTCTVPLRVDGRHRVRGVWFNQPYVKSKLMDGRNLTVSGRFQREKMTFVVSYTDFSNASVGTSNPALTPVYRAVKGITSRQLQDLIWTQFGRYADQLEEVLPMELRQKYKLLSHRDAAWNMHFPANDEALRQARRRLAFEEFFLFQLQLQEFRRNRTSTVSRISHGIAPSSFDTYCKSLPYTMTTAQARASKTILERLNGPSPMNLLLQGDVGSGKTLVALWAAYAVSTVGGQTAMMAPTEILAEQHYREAVARLEPLGLAVELLTGSTPHKKRISVVEAVLRGDVQVVVGTHALLTGDVQFRRLQLVVTDEQHRFGVNQRGVLRQKGDEPDVLFLSATPIPRTLALAIYGDLDVSTLDERPAGRQPVETYWWAMRQEDKAIRFVRKHLSMGQRAFVVAPLVDDSTQMTELTSATALYSRLRDQLAGFETGLLHGRMAARDKEAVMAKFAQGAVQALVSTTVIEVGIDVPEATVMLIYDAERFGLAQLHQLRGRVGRGNQQSYCILLSDANGEVAKSRLQTMVDTDDGFVIAERDLSLRGPGEFFGVRQSGLPEFTVGDLGRDLRMMEVARDEAQTLLDQTDFWIMPKYARLRDRLAENDLSPSAHD